MDLATVLAFSSQLLVGGQDFEQHVRVNEDLHFRAAYFRASASSSSRENNYVFVSQASLRDLTSKALRALRISKNGEGV